MKVLQIISSFPPAFSFGGPTRLVYELSKELLKFGDDITVYTTDVLDKHTRIRKTGSPTRLDGICVRRFRNLNNTLAAMNLPCAPGMARLLRKEAAEFDMICIHEFRSFQAILASHYAFDNGTPFALHPHGGILPFLEKVKAKRAFDSLVGKRIVKNASVLVAVSDMEARQFAALGVNEDRTAVVPNGIDTSFVDQLPVRGHFRGRYSIAEDEKVVLYLGRIHRIKGLDILLEAFARLRRTSNRIRLVIAGPDNGYLGNVKSLVRSLQLGDRVILTGPLYEQDKFSAYVDADLYVLPSSYEVFGNTILEAVACGTPVIVTNRCGISNFAKEFGNVVPYDSETLATRILETLADHKLAREVKENGARIVSERYGWNGIAARLRELYSRQV